MSSISKQANEANISGETQMPIITKKPPLRSSSNHTKMRMKTVRTSKGAHIIRDLENQGIHP
jgi:hypothetical protein